MSQITEYALAASLKNLLNQKTLDKITIKDITDGCGVNRNTFYYHFKDIYQLLDWIFTTEAERVIAENKIYDTWQQVILQSFNYIMENKKLVYHAYNSISRDQLEQYLYNVTYSLLLNLIKEQAKDLDVPVEDLKTIADFYKYAFVGFVLDWIRCGMKEEPKSVVNKIEKICDGHLKNALQNCKKKKINN